MAVLTAMHRGGPSLNFDPNEENDCSIHQEIAKQFDCSIHNCLCQRVKIGLILYPKDPEMKNLILLVCKECYHYRLGDGTPHSQLEKWYFNIYKDSESFRFKTRFTQNEDHSFDFDHLSADTNELFNICERNVDNWEKDIVQRMVQKKSRR